MLVRVVRTQSYVIFRGRKKTRTFQKSFIVCVCVYLVLHSFKKIHIIFTKIMDPVDATVAITPICFGHGDGTAIDHTASSYDHAGHSF